MQSPQSTIQNSNRWKIWHAFNYFVGGGTFIVGSILLFPIFNNYIDAAQISGWLYSIGSGTFLFADITEWLHYVYKDCRYRIYAINYLINVVGSYIYLVGSICFIPVVDQIDLGLTLFIWGSASILFSQTWKLITILNQKDKSCKQCVREDPSGFFVDLFADIGGLMYFCGTFMYQQVSNNADLTNWAALIYSVGGFCFFCSAIFMLKRYFGSKPNKIIIQKETIRWQFQRYDFFYK